MDLHNARDIPVKIIALSDEKYATAEKIVLNTTQFSDVQHWNAVRGSDLFDKETRMLLPNYIEILEKKYPHVSIPSSTPSNTFPFQLISTQAQLCVATGERTNIYDIHNMGAVGCALSHISIWQDMVKHNIPATIVLEDDVQFEERFAKDKSRFCNELAQILSKFSFNFDALNFNLVPIPTLCIQGTHLITTSLPSVVRVKGIGYRTQGYLITLSGAKELLSSAFPLVHTVDSYVSLKTMLPTTFNAEPFLYLSTTKPWLKHPPIDFSNSQIGYSFLETVSDSLLAIPRIALLGIIGFAILSFILVIVLTVVAILQAKKISDGKRRKEGKRRKDKV